MHTQAGKHGRERGGGLMDCCTEKKSKKELAWYRLMGKMHAIF